MLSELDKKMLFFALRVVLPGNLINEVIDYLMERKPIPSREEILMLVDKNLWINDMGNAYILDLKAKINSAPSDGVALSFYLIDKSIAINLIQARNKLNTYKTVEKLKEVAKECSEISKEIANESNNSFKRMYK